VTSEEVDRTDMEVGAGFSMMTPLAARGEVRVDHRWCSPRNGLPLSVSPAIGWGSLLIRVFCEDSPPRGQGNFQVRFGMEHRGRGGCASS